MFDKHRSFEGVTNDCLLMSGDILTWAQLHYTHLNNSSKDTHQIIFRPHISRQLVTEFGIHLHSSLLLTTTCSCKSHWSSKRVEVPTLNQTFSITNVVFELSSNSTIQGDLFLVFFGAPNHEVSPKKLPKLCPYQSLSIGIPSRWRGVMAWVGIHSKRIEWSKHDFI